MSDHSGWLWIGVRIVAPLAILAAGVGGFFALRGRAEVPVLPPEEQRRPPVNTEAVKQHRGPVTLKVDGHVVPYREIVLSAEVAGRVVFKEEVCRAGKVVHRGDLLLEIDRRDYELEKRRLSEELRQAEVMLEELEVEIGNTDKLIALAEEDLKLKEADLNRQWRLREEEATSQAAVDQAKGAVLQAKNALSGLQNQLHLLNTRRARLTSGRELTRIGLEQADLNLQRTRVVSPVDGVVVSESVEVDSYVQRGSPLVTIEDTSTVEVQCHLRMDELVWIWSQAAPADGVPEGATSQTGYQIPQTPATVVYRLGDRQYTWEGILWRYEGIGLDERTRTVPCRVRVDQPRAVRLRAPEGQGEPATGPPALVRGMFVSVEIHARPKAPLLAVPELAVQPGDRVWWVRDGRLAAVEVEVVQIADGVAVLGARGGKLSVGDRVVVSPLSEPIEGTAVEDQGPAAGGAAPESRQRPAEARAKGGAA